MQLLEKITQGILGKGLRAFLKTALGLDVDERTREMEGGFAGLLGGALLGMIAWPVIVSLELETSFYGPTFLGLLSGLIMRSIPLALLLASAGFAGTFFLGMETLMEVLYALLIALSGGARIGALLGKRVSRYSFYDDVAKKYQERLMEIANAAEGSSG